MTRPTLLGWAALVFVCVAAIIWGVRRERSALRNALQAEESLKLVETGLRRLETASAGRPNWLDRSAPEAELAKRVAATLGQNGLSASSLATVEPDAPAPVGRLDDPKTGPLIKRARASVTLRTLTLPEVGRFLDSFRQREPDWTITSVRVEPERLAKGLSIPSTTARDLPLTIALSLESLYVERPDVRRAATEGGIELPPKAQEHRSSNHRRSSAPSNQPASSTRASPATIRGGTPPNANSRNGSTTR